MTRPPHPVPARSSDPTRAAASRPAALLPVALALGALLLAALAATPTRPAVAGERVLWATADRPTSYILRGPDKGRGVVDELYAILQRGMPEYEHQTQVMTFGRVLEMMRSGENVCAVGFPKPEREAVSCFSLPAVVALSYSVAARKGVLEAIYGDVDSVSLQDLLGRADLRGGVLQKRAYGDLNPILSRAEARGELVVLPPGADLVEMLLKRRVDYVIEIASFMRYRAKQVGAKDALASFVIREHGDRPLVAHVFCTRNEWGRHAIKRINTILRRVCPTPQYLEILERWYDPKARPLLRRYYEERILGIRSARPARPSQPPQQ
ncbi:MAG: TIGR02285 family protein [Desulfovibrionaceae bacterium]|jgi:uncharacterized protein (TIGR02285 family)|nr:TIGR02285 family protein [Desulfovibrionaceae bacterium]